MKVKIILKITLCVQNEFLQLSSGMEKYYFINVESTKDDFENLESLALGEYNCTGVEEYSIDEARVDEILGERSYSGGDIPVEVLDEVEGVIQSDKIKQKFYFSTKEDGNRFKSFLKESLELESNLVEEEVKDWNEKWKESFSPIYISKELEIVPSWYEDYKSESNKTLKIYPGMGFGTGTHETTFLCLKLLMNINYMSDSYSCLDFGCGSGILGLALRELNSKSVIDLYDIDKEAIDNCIQNIEINNMRPGSFGMYLPTDKSMVVKKYDLVFANILKNVLIDESPTLVETIKKDFIISGLLNGQEDEVIEHYERLVPGLVVVETIRKNDWCAVHMQIK